jgi:hypothetical protein
MASSCRPFGWKWALFVWAYAFAWFLVSDRVKLMAYRIFDPTQAPLLGRKPIAAGYSVDVTAQIAKRAYAIHEQHGRRGGRDVQDWLRAEREFVKMAPPNEAA